MKELGGERDTPTGRALYIARPIQIGNPACLGCHSTPDAAPATMIKLYGPANGFGWKLNEVVGAQVVSVPMAVPLQNAQRAFYTFMGSLVAVFALVFIALNVMLNWTEADNPGGDRAVLGERHQEQHGQESDDLHRRPRPGLAGLCVDRAEEQQRESDAPGHQRAPDGDGHRAAPRRPTAARTQAAQLAVVLQVLVVREGQPDQRQDAERRRVPEDRSRRRRSRRLGPTAQPRASGRPTASRAIAGRLVSIPSRLRRRCRRVVPLGAVRHPLPAVLP